MKRASLLTKTIQVRLPIVKRTYALSECHIAAAGTSTYLDVFPEATNAGITTFLVRQHTLHICIQSITTRESLLTTARNSTKLLYMTEVVNTNPSPAAVYNQLLTTITALVELFEAVVEDVPGAAELADGIIGITLGSIEIGSCILAIEEEV
jgi:hypothetical protein